MKKRIYENDENIEGLEDSGSESDYPYGGPGPEKNGDERVRNWKNSMPGNYPYGTGNPSKSSSTKTEPSSSEGSEKSEVKAAPKAEKPMFKKPVEKEATKEKTENEGSEKKMSSEDRFNKLNAMKESLQKKLAALTEAKKNKKLKEGLDYLIEFAVSGNLEQAELVLAAKGILDKLQNMAEDLAKVEADDLMPMLDNLKASFGAEKAQQFNNVTTQKIRAALEAVKAAKDGISTQVMQLEGAVNGGGPANDMSSMDNDTADLGMGGMDDDMGNVGNDMEAGASDEEGLGLEDSGEDDTKLDSELDDILDNDSSTVNSQGRARKESYVSGKNALVESNNPDLLVFNSFIRILKECKKPVVAAKFVAEKFDIDFEDVVEIVKEGKSYKRNSDDYEDEGKLRDKKNKDSWKRNKAKSKRDVEDLDESVEKTVKASSLKVGDCIKNGKLKALKIVDIQDSGNGRIKVYTGDNGTATNIYDPNEMVVKVSGIEEGKTYKRNGKWDDGDEVENKREASKNRRTAKSKTRSVNDEIDESLNEWGNSGKKYEAIDSEGNGQDSDYRVVEVDSGKYVSKKMSRTEARAQATKFNKAGKVVAEGSLEEKAKLGSGSRFKKVEKEIESEGKSKESAEKIAASIGRKKFGNSKMNSMAQAGKK